MDHAEQDQRDGIGLPAHLARWINAAELVDSGLHWRKPAGSAVEQARHVGTQGKRRAQDERQHQRDIRAAMPGHVVRLSDGDHNDSGRISAQHR